MAEVRTNPRKRLHSAARIRYSLSLSRRPFVPIVHMLFGARELGETTGTEKKGT